MTAAPNPIATHHLPFFITAPGDTDVLFNITVVFVVASIVMTGVIFLTIHSLPERMAHKSKKVQLDIVALLCLLALLYARASLLVCGDPAGLHRHSRLPDAVQAHRNFSGNHRRAGSTRRRR